MKKTNPNYQGLKTTPNPKVDSQKFNREINAQYKRRIRNYKIAIGILCTLILSLLIPYTILYLNKIDVYFFDHFAIAIVLVLTGFIAFLLPMISKNRISADNNGDNIMIVASFLCFVLAVLTIIMSYMSL